MNFASLGSRSEHVWKGRGEFRIPPGIRTKGGKVAVNFASLGPEHVIAYRLGHQYRLGQAKIPQTGCTA